MPISWSYNSPPSDVGPTGGSSQVVPFCRRMDPLTGELLFDKTRRTWLSTQSPVGETLLQALRTKKGTAMRDPTYGLDLSAVENQFENADVLLAHAIQSCLQRYVSDGRLAEKPRVTIAVFGEAAVPRIEFMDAAGNSGVITGQQV